MSWPFKMLLGLHITATGEIFKLLANHLRLSMLNSRAYRVHYKKPDDCDDINIYCQSILAFAKGLLLSL